MDSTLKVMLFKCKLFTALLLLELISFHANAQLIIDRTGARDLLFRSDMDQLAKESKFRVNFDSKEKSLALGYFSAKSLEKAGGSLRFGLRTKVSAVDGWDDFFKFQRVPGIEFAGIANWTPHLPDGRLGWGDTNVLPFVNLRAAYKHQDFTTFDPSKPIASQFDKSTLDGASAYLSGGSLFSGLWKDGTNGVRDQHGVSFSIGYERNSNYKELKQVEVTDLSQVIPLPNGGQRVVSSGAKSARVGSLQQFNQFPIDLTYSYDVKLGDWIYQIPFVPEKLNYGAIFSPYIRFEPKDRGRPDHGIGLQFSLKTMTHFDPGSVFQEIKSAKLAYPISVFVEWRNAFNSEKSVQAGVASVFTF